MKLAPPQRVNLLYSSVLIALLAFSGTSFAQYGDENGKLILSEVDSLPDDTYTGWRVEAGRDKVDLVGGEVTITVKETAGKITTQDNANFNGADVGYAVDSSESISLLENSVNLSRISSSKISQINGSFLLDVSFGGALGSRLSTSVDGNKAKIDEFEVVTVESLSGAQVYSGGLKDKNTDGNVTVTNNSVTVTDSEKLNTSIYGFSHGIKGAYVQIVDGQIRSSDWSTLNVLIVNNAVNIENSDIQADTKSEYTTWISGGTLDFYAINSTAASNKSAVSLKGNKNYIKGESQIIGNASVYGANVKFDKGADGRNFSISENELRITDKSSVDVTGFISGSMVDYFTTMNAIPTIEATGNIVEISDSMVKSSSNDTKGFLSGAFAYAHNVYGTNQVFARSPDITVNCNAVVAKSSKITSSVYGGFASSQGGGENKMNDWEDSGFNNHDDSKSSYGMNAGSVIAENNIVSLSEETTVTGDVYGSYVESNAMAGQFLTIFNNDTTTAGDVVSSNNQVNITNSTVNGNVYGGYAWSHGTEAEDEDYKTAKLDSGNATASNNTLTLTGGSITGDVYGGYALSESLNDGTVGKMSADNNIVLIGNKVNLSQANLYGSNLTADKTSGNTLNVDGAIGEVASISNFNNLTFKNLQWSEAESSLVVNDGDLSQTSIAIEGGVAVTGELPKDKAQMTVLEDTSSSLGITDINLGNSKEVTLFNESTAAQESAQISVDESGNVILKVGGEETITPTEQTRLLAENRSVAVSFASLANDLIPEVLESIDNQEEGLKTFALIEGFDVKFDVNSDLDVSGWYGLFGAGGSNRFNNATLLSAAFFELGHGNYNTNNTFNEETFTGDGKIDNYALGLALRYKWDNNLYVDTGVKGGRLDTEMDRALRNIHGEYFDIDSDSYYWSAHLGLGKVFKVSDHGSLDVYGRYYYTHTGGESSQVGIDRYEADSITSHRIRFGARYGYQATKYYQGYVGLGYDYEFDGDVQMHVASLDIPTQSSQGSTGFGEIGMKWKLKSAPVDIDMRIKGYTGQWQGASGMFKATYTIH